MSNLIKFSNIYANLSESAYNDRPKQFPPFGNLQTYKRFNYSKGGNPVYGGTPSNPTEVPGIVFLQPDPTVHTVEDHNLIKGDYTYQKGLLTDEKAGFNAYFVTDTKYLDENTKNAYLAVRGSDSYEDLDNLLNDWIANDANFAITNSEIPQAKLAAEAMKEKLKEMSELAPDAKLNITGHSLGTMVSAQGAARLIKDNPAALKQLGNIVLFDGPDVTQSLKNMGLSEKQIKELGDKTTYFVNPLDLVSMLNRTAPFEDQFGQVNVIVPFDFNTTFGEPSAHDFGEFQMSVNGQPLTATKDFHPEMLTAGQELADLIQTTLSKLEGTAAQGISTALFTTALSGGIGGLISLGFTAKQAKEIYDDFDAAYKKIAEKAKKDALAWDVAHIPDYQKRIRSATGSQRIMLRSELLQMAAQSAVFTAESMVAEVESLISNSKVIVQSNIAGGQMAAYGIANYLTPSEVEELLADFTMDNFWDEGTENDTKKAAKDFQESLGDFSAALMEVSQHIQDTDAEGAADFSEMLAGIN